MMRSYRDAILTSCQPNWLPAAAVALWSVARHQLPENVDLIVLVQNASDGDVSDLEAFNQRNGTSIKLVPVEMAAPSGVNLQHWGVGALLMLLLEKYVPADYRRVLHVDVDVLALRPTHALLHSDLQGKPMGAVDEVLWLNGEGRSAPANIGLAADAPYFNGGVVLFDWAKVIQQRLLSRALELLSNGQRWPLLAQDALNVAASGNWHPLDLRWNVTTTIASFRDVKPWIRHFTSRAKPWTVFCRFPDRDYRQLYIEKLADTPWSHFVEPDGGQWNLSWFLRLTRRRLALRRQMRLSRTIAKYAVAAAGGSPTEEPAAVVDT